MTQEDKNALYSFIIGFSAVFSFVVYFMILLFIWPHPLEGFVSGEYPIWDTQVAILITAVACGFVAGLIAVIYNDFYEAYLK